MRISVYVLYIGACLLAIGAAILSGVILLNTFAGQQQQSEDAQYTTGRGQVQAIQGVIANQMSRMVASVDDRSRQLLMTLKELPDDALEPQNAVASLNHSIFTTWVPSIMANDTVLGNGLTIMYVNESNGQLYDRTFSVYRELLKSDQWNYLYGYTFPDELSHVFFINWLDYSTPRLGKDVYQVNFTTVKAPVYQKDNFFNHVMPWGSTDGNTFWYFTYMRSFYTHGVWLNMQCWDVTVNWLSLMQSGLTAGASVASYDSQGYVVTATNKDELRRLAQCIETGDVGSSCISEGGCNCLTTFAKFHPIAELRDLYLALHTPLWDDLDAPPIPLQQQDIQLSGQRYMAIVATLFAKSGFRVTVVWYQPWVLTDTSAVGVTALICVLTMLSTFLLTLLGIFGVLRPLMALGSAMRVVAHTLRKGDAEREAVLQPRRPNIFREVDTIGQDFETIVVDFLGFSSTNARDNKHAPKDPNKPFVVIFTDIQSSTGLWGRDPAQMSRCVQVHHEIIRTLIKDHHLYEVKTAGDSFMITTASPPDALRFALDLQQALYDYDWDWDECDDFYRETTLALWPAALGAKYADMWNGLRVRVGIHFGLGDVVYDEVSKGYDYYGNVVNTAARIEALAHGGQIVVTESLLAALPTPLDPRVSRTVSLGTVPLRGVTAPPALVEVQMASLATRTFPPLRVEHANEAAKQECINVPDLLSDKAGSDGLLTGRLGFQTPSLQSDSLVQVAEDLAKTHAMVRRGYFSAEAVTQHLLVLYRIVEDLLTPLAPSQFATVTKALARGWGVAPPKSKAEFGPVGLRLMQRMSETTTVLKNLAAPHHRAQSAGPDARLLDMEATA
uniref:adenylate cyclase n=1 Tax=Euglena gracilis TaxID=3039 RepID=Q6L877_EUGGR|nr:putative membrane-bound adenylyl cyclase [Euglena gracilis]